MISQDINLLIEQFEDELTPPSFASQHKKKIAAGVAGVGATGLAISAYKKNPHLANAVDQLGSDAKQVFKNDIVEPTKSFARYHKIIKGTEADTRSDEYRNTLAKLRGDNSDDANVERSKALLKKISGDSTEQTLKTGKQIVSKAADFIKPWVDNHTSGN